MLPHLRSLRAGLAALLALVVPLGPRVRRAPLPTPRLPGPWSLRAFGVAVALGAAVGLLLGVFLVLRAP
jgi:hypothetical protein